MNRIIAKAALMLMLLLSLLVIVACNNNRTADSTGNSATSTHGVQTTELQNQSKPTTQRAQMAKYGQWEFILSKASRDGNTETIKLTIINATASNLTAGQPLTWDESGVGVGDPTFACVDQYGIAYPPDDGSDSWYHIPWSGTGPRVYPGRSLEGTLEYRLDPASSGLKLYFVGNLIGWTSYGGNPVTNSVPISTIPITVFLFNLDQSTQ